MKHALPTHLIRARWLAETLPAARIVCAATPAALDVLLYRPRAAIETVADPERRILALFDALRADPDGVAENMADAGYSLDMIDVASYILNRAQPDPDTVPPGAALFPGNARIDLLARRLLAMQLDTDSAPDMIRRYDTPDALLIVLHPAPRDARAIELAVRASTGQVAIATTLKGQHLWPDMAYSRVARAAHTRLFTTFPP